MFLSFFALQVAHKQGKSFTFFLSSEFERSQWVETLQVLQSSLPPNTTAQAKNMSMYELQNWITSCRKFLKTNMGSFLMRSPRDEPLLVGDLVFRVHNLQGLTRPADLYIVVEVDSYGHYFRKSGTQAEEIPPELANVPAEQRQAILGQLRQLLIGAAPGAVDQHIADTVEPLAQPVERAGQP